MLLRTIICFLTLIAFGSLSGCANFIDHRKAAFVRAEDAAFKVSRLKIDDIQLVTFDRGLREADSLVIYIEGDGRVARTRTRLSQDPTPRNPVGLKLALADPSPSVLYIARPCQYLDEEQLATCAPRYWSLSRYAEEVVAATEQVISRALEMADRPGMRIGLVGYSGGGAVAALVAARRGDVSWLVTVAGNLDHEKWTEIHELTPLLDSLNPPDYAPALQEIPQLHLVGEEDTNIPLGVAESYLDAFSDLDKIKVEVVPDTDHHCCWETTWPLPLCRFQPSISPLCEAQ